MVYTCHYLCRGPLLHVLVKACVRTRVCNVWGRSGPNREPQADVWDGFVFTSSLQPPCSLQQLCIMITHTKKRLVYLITKNSRTIKATLGSVNGFQAGQIIYCRMIHFMNVLFYFWERCHSVGLTQQPSFLHAPLSDSWSRPHQQLQLGP